MKHQGIEAGVLCSGRNRRLREFGATEKLEWLPHPADDAQELQTPVLECFVPVIEGQEFQVFLRGPRLADGTVDVAATVALDGVIAAAKSKHADKSWQMIIDGTRVSTCSVRPFKFARLSTKPESTRHITDETGDIRVDVFRGFRSQPSYDPVLRFSNEGVDADRPWLTTLNATTVTTADSTSYAPSDSKSSCVLPYVVEYGPLRTSRDLRLRFVKKGRIVRFVFKYRSLSQIKVILNHEPVPNEEQTITISDSD